MWNEEVGTRITWIEGNGKEALELGTCAYVTRTSYDVDHGLFLPLLLYPTEPFWFTPLHLAGTESEGRVASDLPFVHFDLFKVGHSCSFVITKNTEEANMQQGKHGKMNVHMPPCAWCCSRATILHSACHNPMPIHIPWPHISILPPLLAQKMTTKPG